VGNELEDLAYLAVASSGHLSPASASVVYVLGYHGSGNIYVHFGDACLDEAHVRQGVVEAVDLAWQALMSDGVQPQFAQEAAVIIPGGTCWSPAVADAPPRTRAESQAELERAVLQFQRCVAVQNVAASWMRSCAGHAWKCAAAGTCLGNAGECSYALPLQRRLWSTD
jgi:hypothetical protein